jgi:hypothetical protein
MKLRRLPYYTADMYTSLDPSNTALLQLKDIILKYPVNGEPISTVPSNLLKEKGQEFIIVFLDHESDIIGLDFMPRNSETSSTIGAIFKASF